MVIILFHFMRFKLQIRDNQLFLKFIQWLENIYHHQKNLMSTLCHSIFSFGKILI